VCDWWKQVDGKAASLIKWKTAFDWQNWKKESIYGLTKPNK